MAIAYARSYMIHLLNRPVKDVNNKNLKLFISSYHDVMLLVNSNIRFKMFKLDDKKRSIDRASNNK